MNYQPDLESIRAMAAEGKSNLTPIFADVQAAHRVAEDALAR